VLTAHPSLLIGPSDWQPDRMPKDEFIRRIDALWESCGHVSRAIVYGDSRSHAELAYLTNIVPKYEPVLALLSHTGEHRLLVGGGPSVIGAARPLTWMTELQPLGDIETVGRWAVQGDDGWPERSVSVGLDYMPVALRQPMTEAMGKGTALDITPQIRAIMRRKSSYEMLAIRETCVALRAAMSAIAGAHRAGSSVTAAVLAGERAANARGAQDVRTLFSVNNGRTLQPFDRAIDERFDPLQIYLAVRRFNYWAEGFTMLAERPRTALSRARELLRLAIGTIKAGTRIGDVNDLISAGVRPYEAHPVTERGFAQAIGLTLENSHYNDQDKTATTFEVGEVYSLRVGITDTAVEHAIVSAMISVRKDGNDVFWTGAPEPSERPLA
jgi:hypothetical protein